MQTDALFDRWARAWPQTGASGQLKSTPEDFVVTELADYESDVVHARGTSEINHPLDQTGDHLYLFLEKRNLTSRELARALADANGLPLSSIGYAGMKDKHAVTRQWMSVPVNAEGTGTTEITLPKEAIELLRVRQAKKLRRGWHNGNRFDLVLRDIRYEGASKAELEARLRAIQQSGVPNYFGAQRFAADNVSRAIAWLPRRRRERDAFKRGLHLSVLRSFLFNTLLSARIEDGSWKAVGATGEDPDGALWGRGRVAASASTVDFEKAALAEYQSIADELEFAGLKQERRSLVLRAQELTWEFLIDAGSTPALRLQFVLPRGAYATSLLRELGAFSTPSALAEVKAQVKAEHSTADGAA